MPLPPVQAGASEHARDLGGKGSDCHKVGSPPPACSRRRAVGWWEQAARRGQLAQPFAAPRCCRAPSTPACRPRAVGPLPPWLHRVLLSEPHHTTHLPPHHTTHPPTCNHPPRRPPSSATPWATRSRTPRAPPSTSSSSSWPSSRWCWRPSSWRTPRQAQRKRLGGRIGCAPAPAAPLPSLALPVRAPPCSQTGALLPALPWFVSLATRAARGGATWKGPCPPLVACCLTGDP